MTNSTVGDMINPLHKKISIRETWKS